LKNILIISKSDKHGKCLALYGFIKDIWKPYNVHIICQAGTITENLSQLGNIFLHEVAEEHIVKELTNLLSSAKFDLALLNYSEDCLEMQRLFSILSNVIYTIAVKLNKLGVARRILLPICGGNNVTQLLWFVHRLADYLSLPVHLLHIRTIPGKTDSEQLFNDIIAKSSGLCSKEELVASSIIDGIQSKIMDNDIVIVGAPSYWQLTAQFRYSIPYNIFRTKYDAIMLVAPRPSEIRLRDVLWHKLISLNMTAGNKKSAISQMVQLLVKSNQITGKQYANVLNRLLEREKKCTTAVGEETAFPQVTIPGMTGVVCCLGVFPQGVIFGGTPEKVKFIFLILSSQNDYGEYLVVLSKIARNMINVHQRKKLLKASSSWEILDIMQTPQK